MYSGCEFHELSTILALFCHLYFSLWEVERVCFISHKAFIILENVLDNRNHVSRYQASQDKFSSVWHILEKRQIFLKFYFKFLFHISISIDVYDLENRLQKDPEWWDGEGGGRGFTMGTTCTPVADSCQCMAKTTTIL